MCVWWREQGSCVGLVTRFLSFCVAHAWVALSRTFTCCDINILILSSFLSWVHLPFLCEVHWEAFHVRQQFCGPATFSCTGTEIVKMLGSDLFADFLNVFCQGAECLFFCLGLITLSFGSIFFSPLKEAVFWAFPSTSSSCCVLSIQKKKKSTDCWEKAFWYSWKLEGENPAPTPFLSPGPTFLCDLESAEFGLGIRRFRCL